MGKEPKTNHQYDKPGTYPVKVTVVDKHGQEADATVSQRVTTEDPFGRNDNDPIKKTDKAYASFVDRISPPFAALEGSPKVTSPNEMVDLDASRSHDFQNGPCVEF